MRTIKQNKMEVKIETLLDEKSMKLVNKAVSYTNSYRTITDIVKNLRKTIHRLELHNDFICGSGSSHIWLSRN